MVKLMGRTLQLSGKKLLNLCSNDYLGIPTTKTQIKQIQSSSRLVSGNDEHIQKIRKGSCKT